MSAFGSRFSGDPCFLDAIYCARKTSSLGVVQMDVRDFIGTEQFLDCGRRIAASANYSISHEVRRVIGPSRH